MFFLINSLTLTHTRVALEPNLIKNNIIFYFLSFSLTHYDPIALSLSISFMEYVSLSDSKKIIVFVIFLALILNWFCASAGCLCVGGMEIIVIKKKTNRKINKCIQYTIYYCSSCLSVCGCGLLFLFFLNYWILWLVVWKLLNIVSRHCDRNLSRTFILYRRCSNKYKEFNFSEGTWGFVEFQKKRCTDLRLTVSHSLSFFLILHKGRKGTEC